MKQHLYPTRLFLVAAAMILMISVQKTQAQINAYAKVTAISGKTLSLSNVNQTYHTFNAGDQIVIMQMQDNVIGSNTSNSSSFGTISSIAQAGLFEVATINSVAGLPNSITLTSNVMNTYTIGANSSVQIISYRNYGTNYTTTAAINALPWDGNIGGVVAMQVSGVLTVAYPISAAATGFRGGSSSANYEVNCENTVYASSSTNYANKGEGIYVNTTGLTTGRALVANGGGGGSDDNGGGAGGGNYSAGGMGGHGWTCSLNPVGGFGGASLSSYFSSSRIFMGGGGGGGQQNNSVGSAGANGGGIVLISAASLKTSCSGTVSISANGGTASNSGNDGAGGGGAGGSIVFNVVSFAASNSCPLTVSANGGNGGNVNDPGEHGAGGGGGQGAVIYSFSQPTTNITTTTTNGSGGANSNASGSTYAASASSVNSNTGIMTGVVTILPVSFVSFTAQKSGQSVQLDWSTAIEINNAHFEVERSADAVNYSVIATVTGAGNSNQVNKYSTTDESPVNGKNYYRLKQVDLDGNFMYSPVEAVDFEKAQHGLSLFPNPAKQQFTVSFDAVANETYVVTVMDMSGKTIYTQASAANNNRVTVNLNNQPAAGIYMVKVTGSEKFMATQVLIK